MNKYIRTIAGGAFALAMSGITGDVLVQAQAPPPAASQPPQSGNGAAPVAPAGVVALPPGYVIGPEDVLTVVFWRNTEMSGDVAVRPDGMITLPLVNDLHAAGLTPDQLRDELTRAASKYFEEPTVTVVVKAINSRKVFITGQVGKIGAYPLVAPTTVLQLVAMAGGVLEFAKAKEIIILRVEDGRQVVFKFNYNDVKRGRSLKQNIELKPGDTVIVP